MRKRIALFLCAVIIATSCPDVVYASGVDTAIEQTQEESTQEVVYEEQEASEEAQSVVDSVREEESEKTEEVSQVENVEESSSAIDSVMPETTGNESGTEETTMEIPKTTDVVSEETESETEEVVEETIVENSVEETSEEETTTDEYGISLLSLEEDFYVPSSGYKLEDDMIVTGDLYLEENATLNLSGHDLIVEGNLIQTKGKISVSVGTLHVKGDYQLGSEEFISIGTIDTTASSELIVDGDFTINSTQTSYLGGTLRLKGDFYQYGTYNFSGGSKGYKDSFRTGFGHETIFEGTERQTISFAQPNGEYCKFSEVTFENKDIAIVNGIYQLSLKGDVSLTLPERKLYIGKEIDLNEYAMTINGDVMQAYGLLNVGDGTLHVTGNYWIGNDDTLSSGMLYMKSNEAVVKVDKDFSINSNRYSVFESGTMHLKGNFTHCGNASYTGGNEGCNSAFDAEPSHVVIFEGTQEQSISFGSYASGFGTVKFENSKIHLKSGMRDVKLVEDTILDLKTPASGIGISGELDLAGHTLTINGDLILKSGSIRLNEGTLNVNGNLKLGTESTVASTRLYMDYETDCVNVTGDFCVNSIYDSSITNGTMRIGGDFAQYGRTYSINAGSGYSGCFDAEGKHKVIFDGTEKQTVYFESYGYEQSGFAYVEFQNNQVELKNGIRGFILSDDNDATITVSSAGIGMSGTLDLNGGTLTVNSDFTQFGGAIKPNGGELHVKGNYYLGTAKTLSSAKFVMEKETDAITVDGDFIMNSSNNSTLTAGTLTLKGDFTQLGRTSLTDAGLAYSGNFNATNKYKVIFAGTENQAISFADYASGFANVVFKNKDIELKSGIRGFVIAEDAEINLILPSNYLTISGKIDLNGKSLTINGDVVQTSGTIYVNGGNLHFKDNYSIGNEEALSSGNLCMDNAKDIVTVDGDLKIFTNSESFFTKGKLILKGNLTQYGTYPIAGNVHRGYCGNFKLGTDHEIIFAGTETQRISFEDYTNSGWKNVVFENKNIEILNGICGFTIPENTELTLTVPQTGMGIGGTLDLNENTLHVKGNFIQLSGVIDMNDGTLNVEKDYCIGTSDKLSSGKLMMEDGEDAVNVGGSFVINSNAQSVLTDGVVTIKNDFTQYGTYSLTENVHRGYEGNFKPTSNHKVVLGGKGTHNVSFQSTTSKFNILELRQTKDKFTFSRDNCWNQLIVNEMTAVLTLKGLEEAYAYTGKAITPEIEVYDEDTLLKKNVHYTVTYANNTAVADKSSEKAPTIIVTGKGAYKGTFKATFSILAHDLTTDENLQITVKDMMYTGKALMPVITVKSGATALKQNTDYTVTYGNNIKAGTGKVTITGKGNYVGGIEKEFRIIAKMASGLTIKGVDDKPLTSQTYTGEQIKPKLKVYDGKILLTEGKDYQLTYGENVKLGKGQITLEGIGVYDGSKVITFSIVALDMTSDGITVSEISDCAYDNTAHKPVVTVKHNGKVLEEKKDYTVSYSNSVNAANADAKVAPTVNITGKGNYKGVRKETFTILPETLDASKNTDLVITVADTLYSNGRECKAAVTIMDGKYKLVMNKDYTVTYKNNIEAAAKDSQNPPTAIITGKGNYAGSQVEVPFKIYAKVSGFAIKGANGKALTTQNYTGSQIKPEINVYNGKTLLTEGTHYTVTYGENVKIGRGQVNIEGIGVYGGTKTITFNIVSLPMTDDAITVSEIADYSYNATAHKPVVVVKHGDKVLEEKKDYTITYSNNINAANADAKVAPTVTITGRGNYGGVRKETFTILPETLDTSKNADLVINVADAVYNNGRECKPAVTIMDGKYRLAVNKDYTLIYANNKDATTKDGKSAPTVRITGKGNYAGSEINATFNIYKKIAGVVIKSVDNKTLATQTYTGSQIKPQIKVYNGKELLTAGKDYKVVYGDNVKVGRGLVTVEGIGVYSGTKVANFNVVALPMTDETITVEKIADCTFDNTAHKPAVVVKHGDKVLVEKVDYTVAYANNKNAADADAKIAPIVTITGRGNFKGSCKVTFSIKKASLQTAKNTDLKIDVADVIYNKGRECKPTVNLMDGTYKMVLNRDYTLVYGNNKEIAEETGNNAPYVKIIGKGNYEGETITVNFRIYEKNISTVKVATIANQKYTGKQIKPNVVVTYGSGKNMVTLKHGVDYTLIYDANVKIGTGYVYINGIGTYGGTKKVSFRIIK